MRFPSRKLIEAAGGKIYKTYRIYEKLYEARYWSKQFTGSHLVRELYSSEAFALLL